MDAPEFLKHAIEGMLKCTVYHLSYVEGMPSNGVLCNFFLAFCEKNIVILKVDTKNDIASLKEEEKSFKLSTNNTKEYTEFNPSETAFKFIFHGEQYTVNTPELQKLIRRYMYFSQKQKMINEYEYDEILYNMPMQNAIIEDDKDKKFIIYSLLDYHIWIENKYVKSNEYPNQLIFTRRNKTLYVEVSPAQSIFENSNSTLGFYIAAQEKALNYVSQKNYSKIILQSRLTHQQLESIGIIDKSIKTSSWEGYELNIIESQEASASSKASDTKASNAIYIAIIVLRRNYIPMYGNIYQDIVLCRKDILSQTTQRKNKKQKSKEKEKVGKEATPNSSKILQPAEANKGDMFVKMNSKCIEKLKQDIYKIRPKIDYSKYCYASIKLMIQSFMVTSSFTKFMIPMPELAHDQFSCVKAAYKLLCIGLSGKHSDVAHCLICDPDTLNLVYSKETFADFMQEILDQYKMVYNRDQEIDAKWFELVSYGIFSCIHIETLLETIINSKSLYIKQCLNEMLSYLLYTRRKGETYVLKSIHDCAKLISTNGIKNIAYTYNVEMLCALIESGYLIYNNETSITEHVAFYQALLDNSFNYKQIILSIHKSIISFFSQEADITKEEITLYFEKIFPRLVEFSRSENYIIALQSLRAIQALLKKSMSNKELSSIHLPAIENLIINLESKSEEVLMETLNVFAIISKDNKYCINLINQGKAIPFSLFKGIINIFTNCKLVGFNHHPNIYETTLFIFYNLIKHVEDIIIVIFHSLSTSTEKYYTEKFIEHIFYHCYNINGIYDPSHTLLELMCRSLTLLSKNSNTLKFYSKQLEDKGEKLISCFVNVASMCIEHIGNAIEKGLLCLCGNKDFDRSNLVNQAFSSIDTIESATFYYQLLKAFHFLIYDKEKLDQFIQSAGNEISSHDDNEEDKNDEQEQEKVTTENIKENKVSSTSLSLESKLPPSIVGGKYAGNKPAAQIMKMYSDVYERAYKFHKAFILLSTRFSLQILITKANENDRKLCTKYYKIGRIIKEIISELEAINDSRKSL